MASSAANADLMGGDDGSGDAGSDGGAPDGGAPGGNPPAGDDKGSGDGDKKSGDNSDAGDDAGDLLGDDKKGDDAGKAKQKSDDAPADYDIEVPKELEAFADKEALAEFAKLAKEQKLSEEQANAIAKQAFERSKAQREAVTQRLETQAKEWFKQIASDKEIGGDNLAATKQDIARAIAKYAPEGFKDMAKSFHLQSWPPLMRLLRNVGMDLRPDGGKINGGGGGSGKTETEAEMLERFYGK